MFSVFGASSFAAVARLFASGVRALVGSFGGLLLCGDSVRSGEHHALAPHTSEAARGRLMIAECVALDCG